MLSQNLSVDIDIGFFDVIAGIKLHKYYRQRPGDIDDIFSLSSFAGIFPYTISHRVVLQV